jgi:hypothetical protein
MSASIGLSISDHGCDWHHGVFQLLLEQNIVEETMICAMMDH